jgi:hypothetical protein
MGIIIEIISQTMKIFGIGWFKAGITLPGVSMDCPKVGRVEKIAGCPRKFLPVRD